MKSKLFIILVVLILMSSATLALAAGMPNPSISLIPGEIQVNVRSPFQVSASYNVFLPKDGIVYPGEKIAIATLTVTNVGRIPYSVIITPRISEGDWPNFDIRITGKAIDPNQSPILMPGGKVELSVEVFVGYGSPYVSFWGLALDISPGPAEIPATKKG